jgi:hypothetical protein
MGWYVQLLKSIGDFAKGSCFEIDFEKGIIEFPGEFK